MKKSISFILVVTVLLCCFTSCGIASDFADAIEGKAEATPKVEEMMEALSSGNISDALELMHPLADDDSEEAISKIIEYIDGRESKSIEVVSLSINTSTGTGGKVREEQVSYEVTLEDDESVTVNVVYREDNQGEGFYAFPFQPY